MIRILMAGIIASMLAIPVSAQSIGAHGNAWNNVAVSAAGVSATFDTTRCGSPSVLSIFGTTGGASTLTVQVSQDGSTWYNSSTNTGSVTGAFGATFTHAARYMRLSSSAGVTITATIACRR